MHRVFANWLGFDAVVFCEDVTDGLRLQTSHSRLPHQSRGTSLQPNTVGAPLGSHVEIITTLRFAHGFTCVANRLFDDHLKGGFHSVPGKDAWHAHDLSVATHIDLGHLCRDLVERFPVGDDFIRGQGGELKDAFGHFPALRDDALARLNDFIEIIVPSGMGVFGSPNLLDEFLEPGFVLIVPIEIAGDNDGFSGGGWNQGGFCARGGLRRGRRSVGFARAKEDHQSRNAYQEKGDDGEDPLI